MFYRQERQVRPQVFYRQKRQVRPQILLRRKLQVRPQVFYRRKLQARPQDDREDMTSIAQFYHHSDVKIQCKEIGW